MVTPTCKPSPASPTHITSVENLRPPGMSRPAKRPRPAANTPPPSHKRLCITSSSHLPSSALSDLPLSDLPLSDLPLSDLPSSDLPSSDLPSSPLPSPVLLRTRTATSAASTSTHPHSAHESPTRTPHPPAHVNNTAARASTALHKAVLQRLTHRPQPLGNFLQVGDHDHVDSFSRVVALDWVFELCHTFQCKLHTFSLCVYYLDQLISQGVVSKTSLQVTCAVCLFIACKMEEETIPSLSDMCYFCDEGPQSKFLSMERFILNCLDYNLCAQSAVGLVEWLSAHCVRAVYKKGDVEKVVKRVGDLAQFGAVLGLFDPVFAGLSVAARVVGATKVALRVEGVDDSALDEWSYVLGADLAAVALVRGWRDMTARPRSRNQRYVFRIFEPLVIRFEASEIQLRQIVEEFCGLSDDDRDEEELAQGKSE